MEELFEELLKKVKDIVTKEKTKPYEKSNEVICLIDNEIINNDLLEGYPGNIINKFSEAMSYIYMIHSYNKFRASGKIIKKSFSKKPFNFEPVEIQEEEAILLDISEDVFQ